MSRLWCPKCGHRAIDDLGGRVNLRCFNCGNDSAFFVWDPDTGMYVAHGYESDLPKIKFFCLRRSA